MTAFMRSLAQQRLTITPNMTRKLNSPSSAPKKRVSRPAPPPAAEGPSSLLDSPPAWRLHRQAMKAKYPQGFNPPQRLSREAMSIVRKLHASDPNTFSTPALAAKFKISAEGIRRILKSNWRPDEVKLEREKDRAKGVVERRRNAEEQEVDVLVQQWKDKQD